MKTRDKDRKIELEANVWVFETKHYYDGSYTDYFITKAKVLATSYGDQKRVLVETFDKEHKRNVASIHPSDEVFFSLKEIKEYKKSIFGFEIGDLAIFLGHYAKQESTLMGPVVRVGTSYVDIMTSDGVKTIQKERGLILSKSHRDS